MLTLHTSNQLELLSQQFSVILNTPLQGVFTPETVIVQNAGMARYLSMHLADTTGISANMEYLFPAEFMWKLLRLVSPDIPKQSQCSPETLRFHIMEELSNNSVDYPELHHYILKKKQVDDAATWALSCELSQILDQYLFYRSDWIHQWESATDDLSKDNWQARLWLRCVKDKQLIHWLTLQDQFKNSLQNIDHSILPERVSFFSMSALSPGYLDLLGELGTKTDLHCFIMNPCEDIYWGDIRSEKAQAKLPFEEQAYAEIGNPLLASMGKQGRDFIHQLLALPDIKQRSNTPENTAADTLLQQLQNDVLNLKEPKKIERFPTNDNSISINACHTAMREVEVLHDQILDALETDTSLSPADIVVMMSDIESYAPYIEAVFSSHHFSAAKQKLPFSIADRNPLVVHSTIEALLKVLMLTDTRFDSESVFEILDYESIRTHFNLDESQVLKCRSLARSTNIRWGISANSRLKENLPNTNEHTWKYALDRLLLGYTMGEHPQGEQFFQTDINPANTLPLLPYNDIEGSDAIMLADFKRFTDTLFSISYWQNKNLPLSDWLEKTKEVLQQLFTESADYSRLLINLDELKSNAQLADFEQNIPFVVFHKILQESLQGIAGSESYLGHGITFCALVPMRSVPFKVVALMGMNDGEFPRQDKRHSFDLMANKPRRGDRSRRDEDRYLFLESLLAARSRLIISFIGQNVKDNTGLPPSVLVSELLDTLTTYTGILAEDWICKHPLQAFSPRYFNQSEKLYSYAKEYTSLHKSVDAPSQVFIKARLPELDDSFKSISLKELISFYQSPARTFLRHRFSIQTFDEDITLPIREPFELESFKDREIRNLVLESKDDDNILLARAKGLLPYGDIGDQIYAKEKQIIERFKAQLPEVDYQESQPFSLQLGEFQLDGELNNLTSTGRIIHQVTQPYFREILDVWINHLILNTQPLTEIERHSFFYSPEESFRLNPIDGANKQLEELLGYYWRGLHFPLNFFPKTAFSLYKDKGLENKKHAILAWNGNNQRAGEKDKFENWLLHRTIEMNDENLPAELLNISQLIFGNLYSVLESI